MSKVLDRFLRYVKINTQSADGKDTVPSTKCQFDLANLLGAEMREMGLENVTVTDHAYILGELPATEENVPVIGLCAHIDTALEVSGENVSPRIIENYDGGDITLNEEKNIVMSPDVFENLSLHKGQTLVVTDGTTLLGADDKAGVAEIMTAIDHLIKHPEIKHGKIVVCFCPDEEIGHGAQLWDLDKYGADFAYTVDGGTRGEFSYETFNAASANIRIKGSAVHPGSAKNKMINASMIALELANAFPVAETPEHTELYEGYYHLTEITGGVDSAEMHYIIRDHSTEKFEARKEFIKLLVRQLNERHGKELATVEVKDQYFNMANVMTDKMDIVHTALKAIEMAGLEPKVEAVRGGTDGSRLSFRGLPTPNLFTGSHNHHGPFEYAVVEDMEKAVETVLNILKLYGEHKEIKK